MNRVLIAALAIVIASAQAATIDPPTAIKLSPAECAQVCQGGTTPPTPVPPTPPPPSTIPPNCKVMRMNWQQPQRLFSRDVGGFSAQEKIAVEFTTGSVGTTGSLVAMAAAEYQDPPAMRYAAISTKPCDFTIVAPNLYSGPSNSVTIRYAIAPGTNAFYGSLAQNSTYYFNLSNENATGGNVFVDLIKPGGTTRSGKKAKAGKSAKGKAKPPAAKPAG